MQESLHTLLKARQIEEGVVREDEGGFSLSETLHELQAEMIVASNNLEYEKAAILRDQIAELKAGTGISKIEAKRPSVKYGAKSSPRSKKRT